MQLWMQLKQSVKDEVKDMSNHILLSGYVGSKEKYISKITSLFDANCTEYVEPFVGSGAIYFSHYNGKYQSEWINDADSNIAFLYKALADREIRENARKRILSIANDDKREVAEKAFKVAKQKLLKNIKSDEILIEQFSEIAKNTVHAYTQSFNCSASGYSKKMSNEKYQNVIRRRVDNVIERLQTEPKVTNMDGIEVIKKVRDREQTQLFVDWPYVELYRSGAVLYKKEMLSLYSHIMGAMELRESKAAVVICDYRSPNENIPTIYDAIFSGDEWHCFKLKDTYKHCKIVEKGKKKDRASEYVWTNRVPNAAKFYISMHDYKEKLTLDEYWQRIKVCGERGGLPSGHLQKYQEAYSEMYNGKKLFSDEVIRRGRG